ncbi:MAG: hypothetical protein ABIJ00_14715 [Candidatus Eisenbacteria bacterium]
MDRSQAQEELAFIKKVMEDSQRVIVDNGKQYILWSLLVLAGIAIKYVLEGLGAAFSHAWLWVPIIAIGWLLSFMLKRSTYSEIRVKTFAQRTLEAVWSGWGVAIPILTLIGYFSGAIESWAISPVVATLFGSVCFTTGLITTNAWLRNTAILWWAGAVFMFLVPSEYSVAMLAGMFVLLQLVPGIVIYKRWKADLGR